MVKILKYNIYHGLRVTHIRPTNRFSNGNLYYEHYGSELHIIWILNIMRKKIANVANIQTYQKFHQTRKIKMKEYYTLRCE